MSNKLDKILSKDKKFYDDEDLQKQLNDFSDILSDITSVNSKKKMLWLKIYENALSDRIKAEILFHNLFVEQAKQQNTITVQQFNGPIFAKYIERMTRANDQIIKLAELLEKAQEIQESVSTDDIFDKIES